MRHACKAYLAGPDVFFPEAILVGHRKKQICARYGLTGLFPFDNEVVPDAAGERVDALIYRANVAMIREADIGIINLTPFRGPSADVGTVFELGLLVGLGKAVFGYTNDPADLLDRVRRSTAAVYDPTDGSWRDAFGMKIEDFGNADNLMIDWALAEQGHPIVRHAARLDDAFHDLSGFEACVRMVAEQLGIVADGTARHVG